MATTVQNQMLEYALNIDPTDVNGDEFTVLSIGVNDGEKFTKQRLLDMYNRARIVFLNQYLGERGIKATAREMPGVVIRINNLQFTNGTANIPTDFIYELELTDVDGKQIFILPSNYENLINDSEVNRHVFKEGKVIRSKTGNTFIPNGSNYIFKYIGIYPFTITDVIGGIVTETIDDRWKSELLAVAIEIAKGTGSEQINALASLLIRRKAR